MILNVNQAINSVMKDKNYKVKPTYTFNTLLEAVGVLINEIESKKENSCYWRYNS